mmetsp:Transcript_170548/g.547023  ORF Transcript_170548/g.547023 Transcript_170548/m.547023 type:complete len:296 (-) Transcript_170548:391-1278(-)
MTAIGAAAAARKRGGGARPPSRRVPRGTGAGGMGTGTAGGRHRRPATPRRRGGRRCGRATATPHRRAPQPVPRPALGRGSRGDRSQATAAGTARPPRHRPKPRPNAPGPSRCRRRAAAVAVPGRPVMLQHSSLELQPLHSYGPWRQVFRRPPPAPSLLPPPRGRRLRRRRLTHHRHCRPRQGRPLRRQCRRRGKGREARLLQQQPCSPHSVRPRPATAPMTTTATTPTPTSTWQPPCGRPRRPRPPLRRAAVSGEALKRILSMIRTRRPRVSLQAKPWHPMFVRAEERLTSMIRW